MDKATQSPLSCHYSHFELWLLRTWLKPFENITGKQKGHRYSLQQLLIIFSKLGYPNLKPSTSIRNIRTTNQPAAHKMFNHLHTAIHHNLSRLSGSSTAVKSGRYPKTMLDIGFRGLFCFFLDKQKEKRKQQRYCNFILNESLSCHTQHAQPQTLNLKP